MSAAERLRELAAQLLAEADALERQDAEVEPDADPEPTDDDLDDLIDTATAATRFDLPLDTVRWMAREKGLGEKRGGRWLICVAALREHQTRVKREK